MSKNNVKMCLCTFKETLKEYYELKYLLDENNVIFLKPVGQILISLPWLRHLPLFFRRAFNQIDYTYVRLYEYIDRHIEMKIAQRRKKVPKHDNDNNNNNNESYYEKEDSAADERNTTDFVDAYLEEMEEAVRRGDAEQNGFKFPFFNHKQTFLNYNFQYGPSPKPHFRPLRRWTGGTLLAYP
jgi:hypothetical protein